MRDKVILYVALCQMLLEITDELKETRLYKQSTKNLVNRLQKNLEEVMGGEVGRGFAEDANDFNTLVDAIYGIQNKLVNKKLTEIVELHESI
tara:strand:- start:53 stop:328 length:276 start_codon:yes stop_codon:yes gene_type:complete